MTARSIALSRPVIGRTLPFALPIGVSAFLLFAVQPLIGRLVLPVFGGTPAVWATILFFFQATLLVGYLYGHLSITRLGPWGPALHIILTIIALATLVAAPGRVGDLRVDGMPPVLDLIRILFLLIGLPALVLTTTTPIVSGWFAAARSRTSSDPYWLYALSNAGSLLALLAYPLLIEPRLPLSAQRGIWGVGYAILLVLLVMAAWRALPALRLRAVEYTATRSVPASEPVAWGRRLRWLLLAAVPSGLLSAVTSFIATDLVSAPLLWVAPLSLYLLSFIIAFSPRGTRWIGWAASAAPAMVTLLWVPYGSAGGWPVLAILGMELIAFAVVATALHGRLAQDRPDPARLTEFYLVIALGGALASAFVALLAPAVFPGIWEYPILLVLALVGLALVTPVATRRARGRGLDFAPFVEGFRSRMAPYVVVGGLLVAILVTSGALATEAGIRWLLVGGAILLFGARPWFLAVLTAFVLALATFVLAPSADFRDRSFFGVTEVLTSPDGELKLLMNGTTVHGSQATDPARRRSPQSYYVRSGPVGDLFAIAARMNSTSTDVAIAGLGGGALAAYVDARTHLTFFEIDPVVIDVASDSSLFTYLADASVRPEIVEGDARLSFEQEPDGRFDMLMMDAFSSDSVPVHLMTTEAIADEIRILRDGGLLIFHISNRYYDLAPAITAGIESRGWMVLEKRHEPGAVREPGETPSRWLAASDEEATLSALRAAGWSPITSGDRPFTDDYSDLLRYLNLTAGR